MVSVTSHQSQSHATPAIIAGLKRRWLSINEAAEYIGCCRSLLDKDRSSRIHGIPFSKFGRVIRYDLEDLDAFLQARKVVA